MQSKLQTLSGFRLTPMEMPRLRRDRTGYTNRFCSYWRECRRCWGRADKAAGGRDEGAGINLRRWTDTRTAEFTGTSTGALKMQNTPRLVAGCLMSNLDQQILPDQL